MQQAAALDGLTLDALSLTQDRGSAAEVDVGRGEVLQALVGAAVIVVLDESGDLRLELAWQIVVLEQDTVFQSLVPALDLALCLGMAGRAAGEGGRRRKITKGEAIAKQLVNKAASGDLRAMQMLHAIDKSQAMAAQAAERSATSEPVAPQPQLPQIDFSKLSNRELKAFQDVLEIIDRHEESPRDLPMPPADPGEPPR